MTSNVDELLSFSLRAAAICWSELGMPSLSTVVVAKGWSHGEILGKKPTKTLHLSQGNWERKVYFSLDMFAVYWVVWDTWFSQLHESTKTFCKHFSCSCQQFNRKQPIPVLVIHINLSYKCLSNFLLCF